MSVSAKPQPRVLVLDTAAFLAGTDSLYSLYGLRDADGKPVRSLDADEEVQFFTTSDVIQEVKDPNARMRLKLLEDVITLRMPSKEALSAVIEFAKASGDFATLSVTDLRVVALARMLEFERNGTEFLKLNPDVPFITASRGIPAHVLDEMEEAERREQEANAEETPEDEWTTVAMKRPPNVKKTKKKKKKGQKTVPLSTAEPRGQLEQVEPVAPHLTESVADCNTRIAIESDCSSKLEDGRSAEGTNNAENASIAKIMPDLEDVDHAEHAHDVEVTHNAENTYNEEVVPNADDEIFDSVENASDSDNEGWITSENVDTYLAQSREDQDAQPEDDLRVGCVTTDFAMQNILLQMGIKIISTDGRRVIRQIRRYVLRCHACTQIERDLERKFCGSCGNATLHRVAYKVNKKGVARVFINPKRKPNLRGTKYSIPMTRGGRHNKDLILREDQVDIVKQRRLQKQRAKLNTDVLDPGTFYNAGAKFNNANDRIVVGYGRRNPNESRPGSKSSKQ